MATTEPQTWPCRKGQHQSCVATPTDGICACECHPNWRARAEAAEQRAETYEKQHRSYVRQLDAERARAEAAVGREARLREVISEALRRYELWYHVDPDMSVAHVVEPLHAALAGTPEAVSDSVLVAMSDSRLSDTALEGEQ